MRPNGTWALGRAICVRARRVRKSSIPAAGSRRHRQKRATQETACHKANGHAGGKECRKNAVFSVASVRPNYPIGRRIRTCVNKFVLTVTPPASPPICGPCCHKETARQQPNRAAGGKEWTTNFWRPPPY